MTSDTYRFLDVRPISGSLGAELSGVDLGNLTSKQFDEIYRAFVAHQVVFFRDQSLDEAAYIAFAKRWGDIMLYPYMEGLPDHPEILQVLKEPADTYAFGSQWHTDSSFITIPPKATMLYALELPPAGGDTAYSSMYHAYEALSDGMKTLLADLRVLNIGDQRVPRFTELSGMKQQDPGEVETRAYHPLIRTHPDSGRKALNVGAHSIEIEGLSADESTAILTYLYTHGTRQEFTCRFQWREGTVGIWDNRCVQHYAIDDYPGHRRRMHRITIAGEEAPF
ncbi:MAG: TauD/TfdA dioxygenase family protein [Acidimicrobiales bacterium]